MKCKQCGEENGDAKRICSRCGAFLEGYTLNNVTGEYGYRGADGGWYKSEEEYRAYCSGATHSDAIDTAKVAMHLAMAEIIENREQIIKDGGLFMTFTSDPMLHETRSLFIDIMRDCTKHNIPVTVLTKQINFVYGIINNLRENIWYSDENGIRVSDYDYHTLKNVALGWTLTDHNELEPNAPTNAQRIEEMASIQKYVCSDHIKIWASIEPVIDFAASYDMIVKALDAGCQHFKIGLLTSNTHVVRKDFEFGEHYFVAYDLAACCQFIGYVMEITQGKATVYWKQSFVDFLQGPDKKHPQPIHGMTAQEFLHQWSHSVDKDWSIFG